MTDRWRSNVPVSRPVVFVDEEGNFNGFAWSPRVGIVVQSGTPGKAAVDALKRLRDGR